MKRGRLTEITAIECHLGFWTEGSEGLTPGFRFRLTNRIISVQMAGPWPVPEGIGYTELRGGSDT